MAHERPERDNHAALAIVAALQSDPSGRTVHTGSNPLVPLLNGNFDMLRAAKAADAAFKQWDKAYAVDVHAARAAALAKPTEVPVDPVTPVAPPAPPADPVPPATGEGDAAELI